MKKRILFVDDESRVLSGLQRMLRPLRSEWHMEFAGSGSEALRVMESEPFDIIVSDMRMPGMDGSQLLSQVMAKHPEVVRIVLSGQCDRKMTVKSIGTAHQFLAKPCDSASLKRTINRAFKLRDLLADENVRRLVTRVESVPSLPSLYSEILQAVESPDASVKEIGAIISRDVSMTAKVLQLANSPLFGTQRRISTPAMAILQLGLETVKGLVLSIQVFSAFNHARLERLGMRALWSHSAGVGALAKRIAESETQDIATIENAFAGGLLHDLGKVILAANVPREYLGAVETARSQRLPLWKAEQDRFGSTHSEVGAYLAGLWGFPEQIIEALAYHHRPSALAGSGFQPLTAVHAADILEHRRSCESFGVPPPERDVQYLQELGLHQRWEEWRIYATQQQNGENR